MSTLAQVCVVTLLFFLVCVVSYLGTHVKRIADWVEKGSPTR